MLSGPRDVKIKKEYQKYILEIFSGWNVLSVILLLLLFFVTFIKDPGQGWRVGVGKQSKLRVALAAQLKSQSSLSFCCPFFLSIGILSFHHQAPKLPCCRCRASFSQWFEAGKSMWSVMKTRESKGLGRGRAEAPVSQCQASERAKEMGKEGSPQGETED